MSKRTFRIVALGLGSWGVVMLLGALFSSMEQPVRGGDFVDAWRMFWGAGVCMVAAVVIGAAAYE